jgi:stress protein
MKGRYVDNAGFFALDDFKKVSNEELYSRLLEEFPVWLKAIKNKGMI